MEGQKVGGLEIRDSIPCNLVLKSRHRPEDSLLNHSSNVRFWVFFWQSESQRMPKNSHPPTDLSREIYYVWRFL